VSVGPSGEHPHVFVADLDLPELDADDHHHLSRVLRLRVGDPLTASDGRGAWRPCRLGSDRLLVIDGAIEHVPRPAPAVGVGFALIKGDRPELVVQKLTELGVDEILPFVAARTVVRRDDARQDKAHQRLVRVAREAAMQSRQAWLPTVHPVTTFASLAGRPDVARADRGGDAVDLRRPVLLIGPEGGWAPEERAACPTAVGLADAVLRAETAAIVAGTLLTALRSGRVRSAQVGPDSADGGRVER
jgi:16S rRNA (uracil1498-N3)-methyltransferase